jgi:hypothetical protein
MAKIRIPSSMFRRMIGERGPRGWQRGRRQADVPSPKPAPLTKVEGLTGWVIPYLEKVVKTNRVVVPMRKARVTVAEGPLRVNHKTVKDAVESARIAAQGSSEKALSVDQMPTSPGNLDINVQQKCFGVVLRISDAPTEHSYGMIKVELGFKADLTDTGHDDLTLYVGGYDSISEIVVVSFSDNGGLAQITPSNRVNCYVDNAAGGAIRPDGTWFSLETLNLRDLQSIR